MDIKKSVKTALAKHDKQMKDLANAIGIDPNYLSKIVNGHVSISNKRMKAIADYFDMPVSEFIALGE